MKCPCYSGKPYTECCEPCHKRKPAKDALSLMRSRYAAYALGLVDYIIDTTHPKNLDFPKNIQDLENFCSKTIFEGLEILNFSDEGDRAFVLFKAHLKQQGKDASFIEKSLFEKVDGRWLYRARVYV